MALSASVTSVVVYDEKLYKPGGMVWLWVGRVTRRFSREAKRAAPKRTGVLRAGIRATTPRSYYKVVQGTIRSDAPYSLLVIRGTRPWIRSTTPGRKMAVGRNAWAPVTPMLRVRGQRANNFFIIAWARTGRAHPAVRGVGLPVGLT